MKKSNILIAVVVAVLAAASVAKAEEVTVDFDSNSANGAMVDLLRQNSLAQVTVAPLPAGILPAESRKMYELTNKEVKLLSEKIGGCSAGLALRLEPHGSAEKVLFNGTELLFGRNSDGTKLNITAVIDSPELLRFAQALIRERSLAGGCSQNKLWVKKCYDLIVYVTTIRDGLEVLQEVTKWICEQEWVDESDGPGAPHLPNPNHVRNSGKL
jgi:hypothetical protein